MTNFLNPFGTEYDIPTTALIAFFLIIIVYLTYRHLKKLKIPVDKRFAISICPYIILGSVLRVLEDMGAAMYWLFITPAVYALVILIFLVALKLSLRLERKGIPYFKPMFVVGLLLLSSAAIFLKLVNFQALMLVAALLSPWILIFGLFKKWSIQNRLVTISQMFDATTTFVAINFFGYAEKHVLPTFFIIFTGEPFSFVFVKLVAVVLILIGIDRFSKDENFNNYLKLWVGLLALATGTRDLLRLISGV